MGKGQNNVLCDTVKIWRVSYSIVLFIEPEQIYYYCVLFFGVRAKILLTRNQGVLESRAGPFLGYVKKD